MDALQQHLDELGAEWMGFGPPIVQAGGGAPAPLMAVEDFGSFEVEYAAARRFVGVLHRSWRSTLEVTGPDAADLLHRMLTQDINGMATGEVRPALLLDPKGHIRADLRVCRTADGCAVDLDRFDLDSFSEALERHHFAEDLTLTPRPAAVHLSLLGPASTALLAAACADGVADALTPGRHAAATMAGRAVRIVRLPHAELRFEVVMVPDAEDGGEAGAALHRALLDAAGFEVEPAGLADDPAAAAAWAERRRAGLRGRPIGWAAANTARIEDGEPLFHIDFGTDSLPAEAGLVESHIVMTKGCYAGQEAVARMHNLGHPKKLLRGLLVDSASPPLAGAAVTQPAAEAGDKPPAVWGAVTSSTTSPLRNDTAAAIAMVRWGRHEPGTAVAVEVAGEAAGSRSVSANVVELGGIGATP